MDPRNGHVETIGALGARKREIVAILQSLNEQFEAVATIDEKRHIKDEWRSIYRILEAVNLKIREYDEQRAIDMYLKAYSPTHGPTMDPRFPPTFEALQTTREDLWDFIMSLYAYFEIASTMMDKSALMSDMKTGMLMLGAVMYKIKEYDGTTIAADYYRDAAIRDQQEPNMAVATINVDESPAVAAPANLSAPASLTNGHLSATSSNVKSKPKSSVDTIVRMDLITIPTCTSDSDSDSATTSHNIGINGVRASFSARAPLPNSHLSATSQDVEPEPEGSVDTKPSAASPANFSASAPLPNAHPSTTSSDAEPEPEASVDTNGSSDLNTLPPPAGDTATTSHNTGMNGAPANLSAPAPLSNDHLSTSSSDVESEPEASVDTSVSSDLNTLPSSAGTNVRLDLTTLPPPASDTATTSHNTDRNGSPGVGNDRMVDSLPPPAGATTTSSRSTGMNRALGVRIDRMLGSLARLAEVVRNA